MKLAVFDRGEIVFQRCVERLHPSMLDELLEGRRAAKAVVASTRGEADDVVETVRPYADYLLEFTSQTPVPVANAYHTPETLGRDRLAAAVGALPLALGQGDGAELRQPLGIAVVGGLLVSQLLTLYTTPVVYVVLDRLRQRVQRPRRKEIPHAV